MDVNIELVKIRIFFELFGPPCRIALADLDGSIPECAQVCALHIESHLEALKKIEMVAIQCTNETTPIFWAFNSPSTRPQGPMDPRRGRGTSADIVPTHIKFGVDLSTRCWDIAQKTPKCKNSPLTNITRISFPPFSAPPPPGGAANLQKGRRHVRNQNTPVCKIWRESARGLSRNRWQKTEQKNMQ